jgi:hypothetical protein
MLLNRIRLNIIWLIVTAGFCCSKAVCLWGHKYQSALGLQTPRPNVAPVNDGRLITTFGSVRVLYCGKVKKVQQES